jgi:hypothetical protein
MVTMKARQSKLARKTMTLNRQTPTCLKCGKEIAKPVYKDQFNTPQEMVVMGDNFMYWEYIDCDCKKD